MPLQPLAPTICADVALHCDDQLGRPMAFMATFAYDPGDPYAVLVTFHMPSCDQPWVLSRSLLTRGLSEPTGDGVIRLRPGVDEDGRAVVRMIFSSPEGRLRVDARTSEVLDFLARTWLAVPAGAEDLDADALVAALLS